LFPRAASNTDKNHKPGNSNCLHGRQIPGPAHQPAAAHLALALVALARNSQELSASRVAAVPRCANALRINGFSPPRASHMQIAKVSDTIGTFAFFTKRGMDRPSI
jgi:hypothetical protein